MFADKELIGIELPHEVDYGSCTWCNKKDVKTNIAILILNYHICKDCLKKLEIKTDEQEVQELVKCKTKNCKTLLQPPLVKCSPCRGISYDTTHKIAMRKMKKLKDGAV